MYEYDQFYCPKCGWNGIVDNLKSGFTFPNFCPNCGTNELNESFSGGENYKSLINDIDDEELSHILQRLKGNLEKFPKWVNENGDRSQDRFYTVGIYLTKSQTKLMINILENHNM